MSKPIGELDISEFLQKILELQITFIIFKEKKYFSLKTLVEENFDIVSNEINNHQIFYVLVNDETVVTYLCDNFEINEIDTAIILKFSKFLKAVVERDDIFLLCTELFHNEGKFQNIISFQQPDIAEHIIFELKQLAKKTV